MSGGAGHRILVVDGDPAGHHGYPALLAGRPVSGGVAQGFDVRCVQDAAVAVDLVRTAWKADAPFCLALIQTDAVPDASTLRSLWQIDPDLPIVLFGTDVRRAEALTAPENGAGRSLFLRSPLDPAETCLVARSLAARWREDKAAAARLGHLTELSSAQTEDLRREVAERRTAEAQFRRLAMHDPLTGLYNRASLLDRLRECMEKQIADPRHHFAVLFLDLDNFKVINDALGHEAGDELLVAIAQRLTDSVRRSAPAGGELVRREITARLGGDEFIVLLDGVESDTEVIEAAHRIMDRVAQPLGGDRHRFAVSASIGINIVCGNYDRPEDVLRGADIAMYRAKGSGKSRYAIFDERLHAEAMERLALENDLRHALEFGQFHLAYEPIVDTATNRVAGFEALVRWDHPARGLVTPGNFIPLAEEVGLILPLGDWVLNQAARQLRCWHDRFPARRDLTMSVNLSRRQIIEPGIVDQVRGAIQRHGINPACLNLEITENTIADRFRTIEPTLRQLKELGVKLHMDDFGTGLSSLSCLHLFPIDVLKIDRSFIMNMTDSPQFAALVHAVLTLAQNLRIKVIAEGVESASQLAQLVSLDCDYIQGYHISRSLDPEAASAMIAAPMALAQAA